MRELCSSAENSPIVLAQPADICMTEDNPNPICPWFAIQVRHQNERQTQRALEFRGWQTLIPVYRARRQWSDRVREIEMPLFGGYVFCRFALADRVRIEDAPGVLRIVKFNGLAAPLDDAEVENIRRMVASKVPLTPWPYLKPGDRVRVERGPLRGLEGTLLRENERSRFVVSVELLQRSIAAEIDPDMVVPVRDDVRGAAA
ncbi:MAG: transcription termination/antitermination NusG family protein [Acidobacteriota bacterium]